ncbi:hypothetical protein N0V84_002585 [Fusarium piperis]|uniref:Amidase domain-containing protein n=1 Tax=Fusarium piperis TaxID=1435070 RepID=A0A9W9BS72_9HYPO|nr:hypothetical protein N0V84_002585 [Fusarium piperis]
MSQAFLTRGIKLAERGLIIMGKTNITEFKGMKGVPGYSMYGGMCQPAYIPSGYKLGEKPRGETSPGGSSTGSAVAVTCGFAPISIGTETSGCIASPAATAALYALKLTPGSVSMEGILELTACLDTLGTFGKTALDVALGCDALSTSSQGPTLASFVSSMKLQDVSVGFVDIEKWRLPAGTGNDDPKYLEQTAREYQQAKDMLRQSGVKVVDVYLTPPEERMIGGMNVTELIDKIIRYPMAAVPLGFIESSGRPYGLQAVAQAHQEAKLVRFMAACERVFPPRRQPDLEACKKARPAYVGSSVVDPLLRDAYFMMGW